MSARTRAADGAPEVTFNIPLARSASLVWGDWWGQGVETPAVFRDGSWAIYATVVGARPRPRVRLSYGTGGDRPVAGDWDADGRTDIGVVRGRTWFLARDLDLSRGPATPRTWRRFGFATASGQPVVGDWDGRRGDGIGSYSQNSWVLRNEPRRGEPDRRLTFGMGRAVPYRAGDVAVAGDWTGAGRDGVGVVRSNSWRLRSTTRRHSRVDVRRIPAPPGARPSPWRTAGGPDGQACPTASAAFSAPASPVRLVVPAPRTSPTGADMPHAGVLQALSNAERYLLNSQYAERWAAGRSRLYADVLARDGAQELAIRRPSMAALTVAISVATGAHPQTATGRTSAEAVAYVDYLVRSVACQHASVTPHGWGWGWQSAHWASLSGLAAWLVWPQLPAQTRAYVSSMLLSEAEFQMARPPEYWKDPAGTVVPGRAGDTAAEEVAWNLDVLALAAAMMPDHPSAGDYKAKAVELAAVAYASPSDLHSEEVVNGVPMAVRARGTNALDDGTVVNHNRVHPDYMGNIQHLWWAADIALLAGEAVPEAYFHHASRVYDAFSTVSFQPGAVSASGLGGIYRQPGGTIYRSQAVTNDEIYFPEGSDWGVSRRAPSISVDAHALAYGFASPGSWPSREALVAHTRGQLALTAASRTDDGRTYDVDPAIAMTQDRYRGREEYAAQQVATAWLALFLADSATVRVDSGTYPVPALRSGGRFVTTSTRDDSRWMSP